jgi:hypothetical protein
MRARDRRSKIFADDSLNALPFLQKPKRPDRGQSTGIRRAPVSFG